MGISRANIFYTVVAQLFFTNYSHKVLAQPCSLNYVACYLVQSTDNFNPVNVSFSPNSQCLTTIIWDSGSAGNLYLYSVNPGSTLTAVPNWSPYSYSAAGPIDSTFSPDNNCLAVTLYNTSSVDIFPMGTSCTPSSTSPIQTLTNALDEPFSAYISQDGNCLAVSNYSGSVTTFIKSGSCTFTYADNISVGLGPFYLAFSPDGSCIAVANSNGASISFLTGSSTTGIYSVTSTYTGLSSPVGVTFSPDGKCCAVTDNDSGNCYIFSMNGCSPSLAQTLTGLSSPYGVAFSPDGNCLAVANNGFTTITLFSKNSNCSFNTSVTTYTLPVCSGVTVVPIMVAFSPDGNSLAVTATGGPAGYVYMYSLVLSPQITSITADCNNCVTINGTSSASRPGFPIKVTMTGPGINQNTFTDSFGNFQFQVCLTTSPVTLTFTASNNYGQTVSTSIVVTT